MAIAIREELPIRTVVAYASDAIAGTTWKEFAANVRASCVRVRFGVHEVMAEWRRRVRMRNELITLSEGDLRDIGWTRAEANVERRKPFWRA
jgi:uncharacterized protein YjiS (DUF1127 family)